MTALALIEGDARPDLRVLEGGLSPKRGRPSIADDLRMELDSRRIEEAAMDAAMEPLLNRLEIIARQAGPVLWRTVAEIAHLQTRHARPLDGQRPGRGRMTLTERIFRAINGRAPQTHEEATGHTRKPWQLAPGRALTDGCRECTKEAVMADIRAEADMTPERRVPLKGF